MEQLVASSTIALLFLTLVLRDVLIDHGRIVRATSSDDDGAGYQGLAVDQSSDGETSGVESEAAA